MTDDDGCRVVDGMSSRGNRRTRRKTCHNAVLSTTNPISPDLSSNASRRGGKPATNRMSYGMAYNQRIKLSDYALNRIFSDKQLTLF
jgi:hypothetical protein